MEGLKSYFSSINPRLLNHVSGKPKEFISVFRECNFLSEDAFARKLFGGDYDDNRYREWKSRTVRILQALVIISISEGGSSTKKKFDECQKKFTVGQKFLTQGDRVEGLRLTKQAYRLAIENDFSHLACELASVLHHDHVYYNPNRRLSKFYAEKVKKYLNDYTAEKEAEYYFYQVVEQMQKSSMQTVKLLEAVDNVCKRKGESIKYKVYEASVKVYYGLHTGNYKYVIGSCTDALQSFEDKEGVYPAHYLFFLKNRAMAQTATAQYASATVSYQKAEQHVTNSPYNFYTIKLYHTLNELHAGNYQVAYDLYQRSKRCKIKENTPAACYC